MGRSKSSLKNRRAFLSATPPSPPRRYSSDIPLSNPLQQFLLQLREGIAQRFGFSGFSDLQAIFKQAYTGQSGSAQSYQQRIRKLIDESST